MSDSARNSIAFEKTLADWFLPAITSPGNLADCLDAASNLLDEKLAFVLQMKTKLWDPKAPDMDALSRLANLSKDLERTLRFRLGLLDPTRQAPWFRRSVRSDFGPFKAKALMDPVFLNYPSDQHHALAKRLETAFKKSLSSRGLFSTPGQCLWTYLLDRKSELQSLGIFKLGQTEVSLKILPDQLPPWLETPSLKAFLRNVRIEYLAVEKTLDTCFEQLWSASTQFWNAKPRSQPRSTWEAKPSFDEAPEKPKQKEKKYYLSFDEMAALRFMGFDETPDLSSLKSRFRELAKKMHPDVGGNNDSFRHLNHSFETLSELLNSKNSD